jgi:hypothetical protein
VTKSYAVIVLAAVTIGLAAAAGAEPDPGKAAAGGTDGESELAFEQDGDDLVVSMPLTVNNSDHVLLTDSSAGRGREVTLFFCVVQNRDLLVRSQKQIDVRWRLPGRTRGDAQFRVEGSAVQLPSAVIKAAGGELQDLARKGEEVRPPRPAK